MEEICEKKKCTACAACLNVCPKGAIRMVEEGAAGYQYPAIDPDLCIDCGLCAKTCPANHPVELRAPMRAYAAISRDEADLMSSASGGASSLLAQETLRRGGVVYGCAMESYRSVRHVRIDKAEDAWKIKGSKYVQSHVGTVHKQVKADLQAGREVMFSGTPCQVAGLRRYLRKDYPNLLLVDLRPMGITGKELEHRLDEVYITVNKNAIPDDPQSPFITSGIRVGTPAVTTRGFVEDDLAAVGHLIGLCAKDFENSADEIRAQVTALCAKYPLYS